MLVLFGCLHFRKMPTSRVVCGLDFPIGTFFLKLRGRFRNESCIVVLFAFVFSHASVMVVFGLLVGLLGAFKHSMRVPPLPIKRCR